MDSNKWYRLDEIRKAKVSKRKKRYKDNRNWREYNDKLVREVELILDFPLNRRVSHGIGHPYEYNNQLMLSISALKTYFNLPFRQTEGLCKTMKKQLKLKKVPDYSSVSNN